MLHCRAYKALDAVQVEIFDSGERVDGALRESRSLFVGTRNGHSINLAPGHVDQDVVLELVAVYEAIGMVLHDEYEIVAL